MASTSEILEAMHLLGAQEPQRIHSAVAGLPQELQDAASAAHEHLALVAARLTSRRIACAVQMWATDARRQCAADPAPSSDEAGLSSWSTSPPLDVLSTLMEMWPCDEDGELDGEESEARDDCWRGASLLAQLNASWHASVVSWRLHQRRVTLPDRVDDSALRAVGRYCPALEELDLSADYDFGNRRVTNAGVGEMVRGCPGLRVLRLRNCRLVTGAALADVAQRCPQLASLDVAGCGYYRVGKNLTDDPSWRSALVGLRRRCPSLGRLVVFACVLPADEPEYASLAEWESCGSAGGPPSGARVLERLDCGCDGCHDNLTRHEACGQLIVNCTCGYEPTPTAGGLTMHPLASPELQQALANENLFSATWL